MSKLSKKWLLNSGLLKRDVSHLPNPFISCHKVITVWQPASVKELWAEQVFHADLGPESQLSNVRGESDKEMSGYISPKKLFLGSSILCIYIKNKTILQCDIISMPINHIWSPSNEIIYIYIYK